MSKAFRMRKAFAFVEPAVERRVGTLVIESVAAESTKFTAPMVLVHGLWCTAAVWRRFMGYLAHHGWDCQAVNLRGRAGSGEPCALGEVRFADFVADLHEVIAACEAPPILLGHDLGGLVALQCAARARGVVALAPLVPGSVAVPALPSLRGVRARLALWRRLPLPPPSRRRAFDYFGTRPPQTLSADSAIVLHELARVEVRLANGVAVPQLIVAGTDDAVSALAAVERLARQVGAQIQRVPGAGHALPWEPGWEKRVSAIHRWLVQSLGEPLLVAREDEA